MWVVCLGGRDLEMQAIRELLATRGEVVVHDLQLPWGARASAYADVIRQATVAGHRVALVELINDLPADIPRDSITWIDHHGVLAGKDQPTAIEQLFTLLQFPVEQWTRDLALIAANDRGHIAALVEFGATPEEIVDIRRRDRAAQGITPEEEQQGRDAIRHVEPHHGGKLSVVHLPHTRTATVTDAFDERLGGAGYRNLLIFAPSETMFFGDGRVIERLSVAYPDSWRGGELPTRGYWGISRRLDAAVIPVVGVELMTRLATEIPVKAFHHTVLWPLLMRGDVSSKEDSIDNFVAALEAAGWEEPGRGSTSVESDYTYEEIVYFHPFVRDFLFGDGRETEKKRTKRRFKRQASRTIRGAKIRITFPRRDNKPEIDVTLRVERMEVLLIRPRVAMLLVEFSNRELTSQSGQEPTIHEKRSELTLEQALYLQSHIRQIYPPFFDKQTGDHGDCVSEFKWIDLAASGDYATAKPRDKFDQFVKQGAEPPIYSHWQVLFGKQLQPLTKASDRGSQGLYLQQLLDNRMPGLSFISVENPSEIHPNDLDRLPAFDPPGLDYNPAFNDVHREKFQYTRFSHQGTTYFCNGTSFTTLCNSDQDNHGKCFSDWLLTHYRRHYTHLGVIAQYQHAALLYFADELADTAKELAGRPDEKLDKVWRGRIREIQHRFLKFRGRSFFTEVSNQIQGKDLFQMWFGHLGTQALFERVAATSAEVYTALETFEMKELAEAQKDLAEEQTYLAQIAKWGLGVSIVLAGLALFLQWADLYPDDVKSGFPFQGDFLHGPWVWCLFAIVFGIALTVGVIEMFNRIPRKGAANMQPTRARRR